MSPDKVSPISPAVQGDDDPRAGDCESGSVRRRARPARTSAPRIDDVQLAGDGWTARAIAQVAESAAWGRRRGTANDGRGPLGHAAASGGFPVWREGMRNHSAEGARRASTATRLYAAHAAQPVSAAISNNATHPGCRPRVPTSTSSAPPRCATTMVRRTNTWTEPAPPTAAR